MRFKNNKISVINVLRNKLKDIMDIVKKLKYYANI